MAPRTNYSSLFERLLTSVPLGEKVDYSVLLDNPSLPAGVSFKTKKAHLRAFLERNPAFLGSVTGLIPKPETIISLVEGDIGLIAESNLVEANERCSAIVTSITRPMLGGFVREELGRYYVNSRTRIDIPEDDLLRFLIGSFSDYLKASGNGLVSVAGSINERLLHRAMRNSGMVEGEDFDVTGTDSEADIQIYTQQGTRESLGVEVKSYAARERLLRGLRDVRAPKVGVGYFQSAAEFGYSRTVTYLQAEPAAIYMPIATLNAVEERARKQQVNVRIAYGSVLYRPLENFVSDMKAYVRSGRLPAYNPWA